jgi:hypothetical protein
MNWIYFILLGPGYVKFHPQSWGGVGNSTNKCCVYSQIRPKESGPLILCVQMDNANRYFFLVHVKVYWIPNHRHETLRWQDNDVKSVFQTEDGQHKSNKILQHTGPLKTNFSECLVQQISVRVLLWGKCQGSSIGRGQPQKFADNLMFRKYTCKAMFTALHKYRGWKNNSCKQF